MDRELLIEIGCEEIPGELAARPDGAAGSSARRAPQGVAADAGAPAETYSTPRRLTARVGKLAERQTDFEELVTGPPVSAAFKPDGEPTPAPRVSRRNTASRCRRSSASRTPKGTYLAVSRAPARQGDGRRAAGRDGRPAARPDVPEADALGRLSRGRQGRARVRAARSAGSCSSMAAASCRSSSAAPSWRRGRRCRTSGRAPTPTAIGFLTTSGRAGRAIKVKTFDDYEARCSRTSSSSIAPSASRRSRASSRRTRRKLGGRVSGLVAGAVVAAAGSARSRRIPVGRRRHFPVEFLSCPRKC